MISGAVVAGRGAIVPVVVYDATGQEHALSAVVDTGFNGYLTLPGRLAHLWGLSLREQGAGLLADGTTTTFKVYDAHMIWDGRPIAVLADELETEPMIGMRLMLGFRILIENVDGGAVQIERM